MKSNSQKKYIVLNHIPKCAGSSLRNSFYAAVKNNDYFSKTNNYISMLTHGNICLHLDQSCVKAIHEDTRLFIDHSISYFIEDSFNLQIKEVYRILTIRNPISRFISHCLFFEKKHPREFSFEELDFFTKKFGNLTIETLTNHKHKKEKIETKFEIAKQEIKKYDFIFVQEKFEYSINEFNSTNPFNLNLDLQNAQHNIRHTNKDLLEDNLRKYLEEKLFLEIDLLKNYYS